MKAFIQMLLPWLGLLTVPLAVLYGFQAHDLHVAQDRLVEAQASLVVERNARLQTVLDYEQAADKARAADAANKARVEAAQKATTERIERDYQARIADARARAERLRQQLDADAAAHPGSAGAAPVSDLPVPARGADAAAPQGGFSVSERLLATEQALQLDGLQRWIRAQEGIDRTPGTSSSSSPSGTR